MTARSASTPAVPLLVLTGPCGVGKTTVAGAASECLEEAGVAHAWLDMDALRACHPRPPGDPYHVRLGLANLAALWPRYRAAGATRLVLADVLEAPSDAEGYRVAVPGARPLVVRLEAPLEIVLARLARRESGSGLDWHTARAAELKGIMERAGVGDLVVDAVRAPGEVARDVLDRAGWLPGPA